MDNKISGRLFLLFTAFLLVGCGDSPVKMRTLSPGASSQKAMEAYDSNGDGNLDASEVSPAIAVLLKTGDQNQDGQLSIDEIQKRLQFHTDRKVGLISTSVYLKSSESNLKGIQVRLVPDPIFSGLPEATGISDDNGLVVFQSEGESIPGVCPGLYSLALGEKDQQRILKTGIEIGQGVHRGTPEINIDE